MGIGDFAAGLDAEPEAGGAHALFAARGDGESGGVEVALADDEVGGMFASGTKDFEDVGGVVLAVGVEGEGVSEVFWERRRSGRR